MRLGAAFRSQAESCAALGSPFTARLMGLMADRLRPDHGAVAARMFAWEGDVSSSGASLPLRLAGGLHALARRGHAGLAAAYPPREVREEALWSAASEAMRDEAPFLLGWLDSPPQTNEVGRSAVLRAVGQWLAARHGLPLDWLELGASAGLNLRWDRYALVAGGRRFGPADAALTLAPDWRGPQPPDAEPRIASRRGADLSPPPDADRLLAYVWPDQPDRMARARAALALPPAPVDWADAADWLEALPAQAHGTCRVVAHTVAWQYFSPETRARARAAIERMGAEATPDRPLAWFGMEADGAGPGAGLSLRLWPGDEALDAGRADFHGRWIEWRLR